MLGEREKENEQCGVVVVQEMLEERGGMRALYVVGVGEKKP